MAPAKVQVVGSSPAALLPKLIFVLCQLARLLDRTDRCYPTKKYFLCYPAGHGLVEGACVPAVVEAGEEGCHLSDDADGVGPAHFRRTNRYWSCAIAARSADGWLEEEGSDVMVVVARVTAPHEIERTLLAWSGQTVFVREGDYSVMPPEVLFRAAEDC